MRGVAPPEPMGAATDRWPAFADAFDGALPVVYRYLYSGTGGDRAVADELTAGVFMAAAARFAAGDDGALALGTLLHDALRALARPLGSGAAPSDPAPPGPARAAPARSAPRVGGDGAALRQLPFRLRVVLGLRYHDHLPVDEIAATLGTTAAECEDALRDGTAAFLAAAPDGAAGSDGVAERLWDLFAALDARPSDEDASRLRDRARGVVRSAPAPPGPVPAPPPAAPRVTTAPPLETNPADAPPPLEPSPDPTPPTAPPDPAPDGASDDGPSGAIEWDDGLSPLPAAPPAGRIRGSARVRTARSPRSWGLPAVIVTAAVLVGAVVTGAGDGGGDTGAPAAEAPAPAAGRSAPAAPAAPATGSPVDQATALAGVAVAGDSRPAPAAAAAVVRRVRLGPGGPYMNGPYALAAGDDEGMWAAVVGDDGTWQAVRVDPATGATLAAIRIPGRIPSDRSHHGIAVSGGYVWTPALRDGLFRIDASTNTASGIIAVAGGVDGSALDAGDGAVWAVGHDNVLRRLDAQTTEVTATALIPEMGLLPDGVDLAYGGSTVWVTISDGAARHLIGFDPTTLARRYHYTLSPLSFVTDAYDLDADADRVVMTEAYPGGVTVVDAAAGQILGQHRFVTNGIAIDGDRAWVLSALEGRATMVWTRTGEVLATAVVPTGVETMVSTRDGGVWAAVPSSGELVQLRFAG